MPKLTKTVVDSALRNSIFDDFFTDHTFNYNYEKVNDRQYGVILVDKNGTERYCRVGVIVAEEREDMTARELMQSEIDAYNAKQTEKAEKAKVKAAKAAKDKETRAKKAKEEKGE